MCVLCVHLCVCCVWNSHLFDNQVASYFFHSLKFYLRVGCWNVHSLVEAGNGVKIATVRTIVRSR